MVLAAFLFMHRMGESVGQQRHDARRGGRRFRAAGRYDQRERLPPGVAVFRITGPLFFAAASRLDDVLDQIPGRRGSSSCACAWCR